MLSNRWASELAHTYGWVWAQSLRPEPAGLRTCCGGDVSVEESRQGGRAVQVPGAGCAEEGFEPPAGWRWVGGKGVRQVKVGWG